MDDTEFNDSVEELDERDRKKERVFRRILDELRDRKNHFLAVSAKMGKTRSYISSVPLHWFAKVHFASSLDVFEEYRDEQGKSVKINESTIELMSQRKPDWRRQLALTAYLSVSPYHKFPPVLLVAYQDWIFKSDSDKWGADGCALEDSVTHKDLDSKSWVVDLDHDSTQFYALDGQHRLMAVKGLQDLLDNELYRKKENGIVVGKPITLEDIMHHDLESQTESDFRQKLNAIMEEKIGVEIIPAVQVGETIEKAFGRLRRIFVDVNQQAKRLEKGELALLDETNGFSIVARRTMISNRLFYRNDKLYVDTKRGQLDEKSQDYTTLQSIVRVAFEYLGQIDRFRKWKEPVCDIKDAGLLRPSDEELEEGEKKLSAYFNAMKTLPSHDAMIQGKEIAELRRSEDGDDNILFRPIAQEALAQAIGALENENKDEFTPEKIIKVLGEQDNPDKPALRLTDPASPFFGVLCNPVTRKMRNQEGYRTLAGRMFRYLLNAGEKRNEIREQLREDVFKSRRNTPEGTEPKEAIGYDGKQVTLNAFKLPDPW